jgi:O-acetyl-ADP-ribose deacetylase (regulator of RNase III)/nicotinamidase-related amidase
MKIEIRQGDISDQPDIDAIVNAANTDLTLGSGVAGAIRRKGGDVIDEEGQRQAPIRLGEAAVTTAGSLPNKYVIHAAAMGYRAEDRQVPKDPGTGSSAEIIRDATLNSLRRAEALRLKSVAFPALATGVARFPVDRCAEVMIAAAREYGEERPDSSVEKVVFVLFTPGDYAVFKRFAEKTETRRRVIFFDVDTQRDFMDATGALYVPGAEAIRSNIERLLLAASEHGVTTISSRCAHSPDDPEFEIFPPHCIDGQPGAERVFAALPALPRQEVAVDAGTDPQAQLRPALHYIVKKKVFDLFSNRWLDGLRRQGEFNGEPCVVFGVATDYCVRACALGLAEAGARVLLVEDAIWGVAGETTSRAFDEMRAAGVEFTTTDEVLKGLG